MDPLEIHQVLVDPTTTKHGIVHILRDYGRLPLAAIQKLVREKYNLSVKKSSLFESLKKMEEKKIIIKHDRKYSLNQTWLKEIESFVRGCNDQRAVNLFLNENSQLLEFESLDELDKFYLDLKKNYLANIANSSKEVWWAVPHLCWNFLALGENIKINQQIRQAGVSWNILVKGNTPLDNFAAKMYECLGFRVRPDSNHSFLSLIGVFDDFVLKIDYHPKMIKAIEEMFATCKSPDEVIKSKYTELYHTPLKHYIHFIRNPGFKKMYLEEIKAHFEAD